MTVAADNHMDIIMEIEERAKEVLDNWGIDSIPVNPIVIAINEGINVYQVQFADNVSGLIRKHKDNSVEIYLKDGEYRPRQRFTTAHELGHYYLHLKSEKGNFVDGNQTLNRNANEFNIDTEEAQANQFAAALLMPVDSVLDLLSRDYSVYEMAKAFDVSLPAMKIRLETLKTIGVI